MSGRAGRGGRNQVERNAAATLGIARHEMHNFQSKQVVEPPPLYPAILNRSVLPLKGNREELQYMADLKQEIFDGFRNSEFFLDKEDKGEIHRYIDKYNKLDRGKFKPDFSRLPDEICWVKDKQENNKVKRKKLDESEMIRERLNRLEENEKGELEENDEETSKTSEKSEHSDVESLSENDAEEDNDYTSAYFDNGEGYGDAGSDDNVDGDDY